MSIGKVAPQETPESEEIEAIGYDELECPFCEDKNITSDYLYDDETMFERFECQECGCRWTDDTGEYG